MSTRLATLLMVGLLGGTLAPSTASACDEAERLRLSDEIKSLAQKNAWAGVERKYIELIRTKCELKVEQHSIGAESAKNLGKTFENWERLSAANALESQAEVATAMSAIEEAYGRVEIRGDARHRAPLLRDEMPFAPDQRKSIEYAQSVMEGTGSFKGMLPHGTYRVADKEFTVASGGEFQIVTVGKGKAGPVNTSGGGDPGFESQGLINWAGPVAFVGGGFFGSPAPSKVSYINNPSADQLILTEGTPEEDCGPTFPNYVTLEDGTTGCAYTRRQPTDISMFRTPSIELTVGGEAGLTYKAPEAGVVGTVSYRRMFGNSLNQVTLMGGAMLRPGNFRFVAGPTFGVVFGGGSGYVDWVEEGQSDRFKEQRQPEERYSGFGMGGGFAGSAGYGVLDLEPFQGLIELHGHFQHDGSRAYSGIGLRVGIVPKISRFEG